MLLKSEDEMLALGADIAQVVKAGDVLLLQGDLGVGKSVLARSIIRAWLGDESAEVPSPSFTLVQNYQGARGELNHFDLYRLGGADELIELGLPDLFERAVSLVEWPERLAELAPDSSVWVSITDLGGEQRRIEMTQRGKAWTI